MGHFCRTRDRCSKYTYLTVQVVPRSWMIPSPYNQQIFKPWEPKIVLIVLGHFKRVAFTYKVLAFYITLNINHLIAVPILLVNDVNYMGQPSSYCYVVIVRQFSFFETSKKWDNELFILKYCHLLIIIFLDLNTGALQINKNASPTIWYLMWATSGTSDSEPSSQYQKATAKSECLRIGDRGGSRAVSSCFFSSDVLIPFSRDTN